MNTEKDLVTGVGHYNRFLPFVLVLFFASEALTKIAQWYKFSFYNISALVKLLFILVTFCLIIKKRKLRFLSFFGVMGVVFLLGQLIFNNWEFNTEVVFSNLIYFGRYIFVFFIISLFNPYQIKFSKSVFKIYEIILLFNSLLIIAGYFFKISLFQTYLYRFGYNGLFMTPTMISYFNALGIIYFLRKSEDDRTGYLPLILIVLSSLLTGTKAILLFILFTAVYLVIKLKLFRERVFIGSLLLLFGIVIGFWKVVFAFLKDQYSVLYEVYINDGLLSMLTSYRNHNFIEIYTEVIQKKWVPMNYLFGGTDFDQYRIEFDLLDVFLFFGIIGGVIYLWAYFSKVIIFNKFDNFSKVQIIGLLFIGILAGTFFNGAPLALYLIIVLNYLYFNK